MIKKNDVVDVTIHALEFPNVGVGEALGERVVVKNSVPGQRLRVKIIKIKRGPQGNVVEVLSRSPLEIEPECDVFGICGGCSFQNLDYEKEVELKGTMVTKILASAEIDGFTFFGTVPAPKKKYYRNKMEFSFGDDGENGNLTLGMRIRGSYYEAVNANHCMICDSDFNRIVDFTLRYFTERGENFHHRIKLTGALRNLVVRKAFFTGEILVNIVTTSGCVCDLSDYAEKLAQIDFGGKLCGVINTLNDSVADAVKPDAVHLLYGKSSLTEKLLGLTFNISPFSFFQTNSQGAELLYSTVRDFAGDIADKTVFDLYCGTGTIAQIMAEKASRVIGVELVAEAVTAAKENAALNTLHNCEFICGDVLKVVDEIDDSEKPDVIVLDPPREGIHPKAIGKIINFGAKTIVYVSCKPTSMAVDLHVFIEAGYRIEKVKCHDMFPRTGNIETVVKMVLAK